MIKRAAEMQTETREKMRGGNGHVSIRHIFQKDEITARTRLCARLLLPPGASIGPHAHDGEDELFYIIKGEGLIEDDGALQTVSAGDAVLTGKGQTHAIINTGNDDLEILAVIMLY